MNGTCVNVQWVCEWFQMDNCLLSHVSQLLTTWVCQIGHVYDPRICVKCARWLRPLWDLQHLLNLNVNVGFVASGPDWIKHLRQLIRSIICFDMCFRNDERKFSTWMLASKGIYVQDMNGPSGCVLSSHSSTEDLNHFWLRRHSTRFSCITKHGLTAGFRLH